MSMLAENPSRRKTKWTKDPNNTAWSNDDSKFGMKMMEKMGWSKGKGLGVKQQGNTEHIKIQLKDNNLGIGAKRNHSNNWMENQDAFSDVLAKLNSAAVVGAGVGDEEGVGGIVTVDEKSEMESTNLEEKISTSKRLFYSKFVKNKNLSNFDAESVANIFGKKGKKEEKKNKKKKNEDGSIEEEHLVDQIELVESKVNMNDYFKAKMAQMGKSLAHSTDDHESQISTPSFASPAANAFANLRPSTDDSSDDKVEKKEKMKKSKKEKKEKKDSKKRKLEGDEEEKKKLKLEEEPKAKKAKKSDKTKGEKDLKKNEVKEEETAEKKVKSSKKSKKDKKKKKSKQ
eukprot:Nk52_evm55s1360 gene=Nk52_evmTU55s1360